MKRVKNELDNSSLNIFFLPPNSLFFLFFSHLFVVYIIAHASVRALSVGLMTSCDTLSRRITFVASASAEFHCRAHTTDTFPSVCFVDFDRNRRVRHKRPETDRDLFCLFCHTAAALFLDNPIPKMKESERSVETTERESQCIFIAEPKKIKIKLNGNH